MLKVEWKGEVLHLELNRPEVRNAFNDLLIAELHKEVLAAEGRARVILITGAGKAFCAGGDLNWMKSTADNSIEENQADAFKLASLLRSLGDSSAVVIAGVQGSVFGGGCGLVAASDYTVAAEDAQFCFSEVKLGLVPAVISPHVITKIGQGQTRALFTTALVFGSERAEKIGLAQEVVSLENLAARVWELARMVLKNGPDAVAMAKRVAMNPPMTDQESSALLADRRASNEGQEGMAAFLQKRPAAWVKELE